MIRCARLESYTKALAQKYGLSESVLVLTGDALASDAELSLFQLHLTNEQPVRDFPNLKEVYWSRLPFTSQTPAWWEAAA